MIGPCSLYYKIEYTINFIKTLSKKTINESQDDIIIGKFLEKNNIPKFCYTKNCNSLPFKFHDVIEPLTKNQKIPYYKNCWM